MVHITTNEVTRRTPATATNAMPIPRFSDTCKSMPRTAPSAACDSTRPFTRVDRQDHRASPVTVGGDERATVSPERWHHGSGRPLVGSSCGRRSASATRGTSPVCRAIAVRGGWCLASESVDVPLQSHPPLFGSGYVSRGPNLRVDLHGHRLGRMTGAPHDRPRIDAGGE